MPKCALQHGCSHVNLLHIFRTHTFQTAASAPGTPFSSCIMFSTTPVLLSAAASNEGKKS